MTIFLPTITILLLGTFPVGAISRSAAQNRETNLEHSVARDQARTQRCEQREAQINKHVKESSTRQNVRMSQISDVQQKVEEFYTSHQLLVGNYTQLISDANAKEQAAATAVANFSSATFVCKTDDQQHPGQAIKESFQASISALQSYRQSVHLLISNIKTVAKQG